MADKLHVILEYLQRNNFKTAEAALKAEIQSRHAQRDSSAAAAGSGSDDADLPSPVQIQPPRGESKKPSAQHRTLPDKAGELLVRLKSVEGKDVEVKDDFLQTRGGSGSDPPESWNVSVLAEGFAGRVCTELEQCGLSHASFPPSSSGKTDPPSSSSNIPNEGSSKTKSPQSASSDLRQQCPSSEVGGGLFKDLVNLGKDLPDSKRQNVQISVPPKLFGEPHPNDRGSETLLHNVQGHGNSTLQTENEPMWRFTEDSDLGQRAGGAQHGKVYPLDEVGSPQGNGMPSFPREDNPVLVGQRASEGFRTGKGKAPPWFQAGVFTQDENFSTRDKITDVQECPSGEQLKHNKVTSYMQEPFTSASEKSICNDLDRFEGFPRAIGNLPFPSTWHETSGGNCGSSAPPKFMYEPQPLIRFLDVHSHEREGLAISPSNKGLAEVQNYSHDGSSSSHAMGASCDSEQNLKELAGADCIDISEEVQEPFPRLPPVRLKSWDKNSEPMKELFGLNLSSSEENVHVNTVTGLDTSFGLGAFLDVPVGQDVSSSGGKRLAGSSRPSVSQGIIEDTSELLSGFATAGDGLSESVIDYPDEYWDSDTYDDDDDPGYLRQPIDDEAYFLATELLYPNEESRSRSGRDYTQLQPTKDQKKYDDDDHSYVDSYFSGEEVYHSKGGQKADCSEQEELQRHGSLSHGMADYKVRLCELEESKQAGPELAWQGFDSKDQQSKEDKNRILEGFSYQHPDSQTARDTKSSIVGGLVVNEGLARNDVDVRESWLEKRGEKKVSQDLADFESSSGTSLGSGLCRISTHSSGKNKYTYRDSAINCMDEGIVSDEEEHVVTLMHPSDHEVQKTHDIRNQLLDINSKVHVASKGSFQRAIDGGDIRSQEDKSGPGIGFSGFSFPSPSSKGDMVGSGTLSGPLLPLVDVLSPGDELDAYATAGPDDPLASWRRKSNESSPIIGSGDAHHYIGTSGDSSGSGHSTDESGSKAARGTEDDDNGFQRDETDPVADFDEVVAVQEQFQRLQSEEDDFEIFDLRIVHRKNRTGFEEEKEFPVVINSIIAGRYHVTEYLGSAAFSKAIQAHDLHTGMDVCMKIIKNNKDFFDQSLDEIKLLKYINRHDPADKHHVLRLYDYFYHREHLFIVCELLRANLYEFHKYNRESGGEVYFTMPRLQSIARQCLEALEFLHGLGLIHCDLKPENILVKSYSRCEVKVIDLGSSCFQTDHLCSYVQSRSYRAPEVILGLPYNQKIDIWSLGCILAELSSGNVLFQNDSLATLLARVIGILGPIDPEMLAKGHDTHKYFTKNYKLYERNPDTDRLEYLLPKKTSLAHRLPMGDQGFVDFVDYLLQINPQNRPCAGEALKHPWLGFPYEPISS